MAAAGVVAAAVYNAQRTKDSDPLVNAADFIPPTLGEISREPEAEEEEGELTIEELSAFFGAKKAGPARAADENDGS